MSSKNQDFSKAIIEYNCLRQYIRKINHLIPSQERFLCVEWLKRLRPTKNNADDALSAAYIERMFSEIMQGYLCSPFNKPPPPGELRPLPPPHSHSEAEGTSLDSVISDTTMTEVRGNPKVSKFDETAFMSTAPPVNKAAANPMEFLIEEDESEMSSLTSSGKVEMDTRSEPNTKSKMQVRRSSEWDVQGWMGKMEETAEDCQKSAQEDEQDRDDAMEGSDLTTKYGDEGEEVASQVDKVVDRITLEEDKVDIQEEFENGLGNRNEIKNGNLTDNVHGTVENVSKIKDLKIEEEQGDGSEAERIALYYADLVRGSLKENKMEIQRDNSIKLTKTVTNFDTNTTEKTIVETTPIDNRSNIIYVQPGKSKEVQEVFLNKNYASETGQDLLMDIASGEELSEKSHHVFDMLLKFANLYEKRGTKSMAFEQKIQTLTNENKNLIVLNDSYKAEIQNLEERINCLEAENREIKDITNEGAKNTNIHVSDVVNTAMDATTSMELVDMDNQNSAPTQLVSGERIADITTKLNALLKKSNLHNEKLAAIDVKFNLVRNDYELERKEMILKFKSIDNLHQNILTELVKRQMSETKEYQNLIDHYRAQFSEKNAEIARLRNNACDACAKRQRGKDRSDGKHGQGDVDERFDGSERIGEGIGEELKLRREIDRLRQTNKELIYTYEKKIKRLMNEKYLESRLKDTILKAQRDELELHLNGQKHEELRALAERLEGEYVRVVDEAMRQAVSKLDMTLPSTSKEG